MENQIEKGFKHQPSAEMIKRETEEKVFHILHATSEEDFMNEKRKSYKKT